MGNDDGLDTSHPVYGLIPGSDTDSSVPPKGTSLDALADGNFSGKLDRVVPTDPAEQEPSKVKVSTLIDPRQHHSGNSATAQANTSGNGPALTNTYLSPVEAYLKTLPEEERTLVNRLAPQLVAYGVSREAREIFLTTPALYSAIEPPVFVAVARCLETFGSFSSSKKLSLDERMELLSNPESITGLFALFNLREDSNYRDARKLLAAVPRGPTTDVL